MSQMHIAIPPHNNPLFQPWVKEDKMYSHACAGTVASEVMETLASSCDTLPDGSPAIQIVGSLRRLKQGVNDVDIIAIPKFTKTRDSSLFGEPVNVNLLDQRLSELCLSSY